MTSDQGDAPGEAERARLRAIHDRLTGGDISGAQTMAAAALADGIDHPMVLSLAAGRLEAEGRFEESLVLLRRAEARAPGAPGLLNAIGICLNALGRWDEAVDAFDAALARDPGLAPARANRGEALVRLGRFNDARADFEAALAADPGHVVALNGLATLAVRRGDAGEARARAEAVLARVPGLPGAVLALAEAEIAEGAPAAAEARLDALIAAGNLVAIDAALAHGLIGDARDAEGRFAEAFAAYEEANAIQRALYAPGLEGRPGTFELVRAATARLDGRKLPIAFGAGGGGPARRHVFLVGFPRSGTTLLEQVLEGHEAVTTLAEKECLIDAARAYMADGAAFDRFLAAGEDELEPFRAAYWRRVAEAGADPAGKVFVDKHPFNTFKLPLIARLFPEARILFARRDPRDIVLSCFRQRFQMSAPMYQLLTLTGAAELYAATMALAEASAAAFSTYALACPLEALIADFDGETRKVCDYLGIDWTPALRDFAARIGTGDVFTPSGPQLARGLSAAGVGKWRDYEAELAPALPILQPWVEKFGYS